MEKALSGTLYLVGFAYSAVITSELSQGMFFNGIQKKLDFLPFVDVLTHKNMTELAQNINSVSLLENDSLKMLAVGVILSFAFGLLISKYLISLPRSTSKS